MSDDGDLTATEVWALDFLDPFTGMPSLPPGVVPASLFRRGLVITLSGRTRLTHDGRALFDVCGVAG